MLHVRISVGGLGMGEGALTTAMQKNGDTPTIYNSKLERSLGNAKLV